MNSSNVLFDFPEKCLAEECSADLLNEDYFSWRVSLKMTAWLECQVDKYSHLRI